MMPLFILYGGEIVIAIVVARIALWIVRSGGLRLPREQGPGGPGGPRGLPGVVPGPAAAASAPPAASERSAA